MSSWEKEAAAHNWTHKPWCRPSDPINIIFHGIDIREIETFLVRQGWKVGKGAKTLTPDQVIPDPSPTDKRVNDLQLFQPTKWWTFQRYHVRFWKLKEVVIASVHLDALRSRGHTASDFESIEKYFAGVFRSNPSWVVDDDAVEMDNRFAGYGQPYNNGKATVVHPL